MRRAGQRRLRGEPRAMQEEHQSNGGGGRPTDRHCGFTGGRNERRQGERPDQRHQEWIEAGNLSARSHGHLRRLKSARHFDQSRAIVKYVYRYYCNRKMR
jgi:hypothetical protein